MHNTILFVLLIFPFVSINASDRPTGLASYFMKAADLSTASLPSAGFNPSVDNPSTNPLAVNSSETTAAHNTTSQKHNPTLNNPNQPANSSTSPASNINSQLTAANVTSTNPVEDPPDQSATSTCRSDSSRRNVTFHDRACWFAAKILGAGGTSAAQCGNCVLGLFDADKKVMFKPPGPAPPGTLEGQTAILLMQCKNNNPPKVTKRDASSSSSSSGPVNIQLLMGYNDTPKDCPGL